mgnify:CR=1 FL=1
MKIILKSEKEISIMREGGKILAEIFENLEKKVKVGVKTKELEKIALDLIFKKGARPSFLGYQGFPSCLCTSINEEIVHCPPSERILRKGDILKLDLGIIWKGFHLDKAVTVPVGKVSSLAKRLIKTTKKCLGEAIKKIKAGVSLGDIGWTIENCAKKEKFNVIRSLGGHGIGRSLHEPPFFPNFGERGKGLKLKEGMVFCLEPMLSVGDARLEQTEDGFGYRTVDRSLTAHFEETIALLKNRGEILTEK